eukprot:COSAG03_NODE_275_length_9561_cov_4.812408_2_plen_218_part_00
MNFFEQALDAVGYFVAADVAAKEGTAPPPPNDSISPNQDHLTDSSLVQVHRAAAESEHAKRDSANLFGNLEAARLTDRPDVGSPLVMQIPPQLESQSPDSAGDVEPCETAAPASVSPAAAASVFVASPEEPSVKLEQVDGSVADTGPTPAPAVSPCLVARPRSQRRRTQVIRAHFIASDTIGLSFGASPSHRFFVDSLLCTESQIATPLSDVVCFLL